MCHDPSVQGRCREQARRAEQVRNHCYGPAPRRTPVSTAHAFSFFAPCLSQLLHRAQRCLAFPAHAHHSGCQALQTIACSPGEDDRSPCPVMLCPQSPPVSICSEYFPRNRVFLATYSMACSPGRTVRYLQNPPLVLLFVVSYIICHPAVYLFATAPRPLLLLISFPK